MKNLRSRIAAVSALTVVLATAGCAGDDSGSDAGDKDDKLVIAVGGIQGVTPWAQHLAARGQGAFDDLERATGQKIEFIDVDSSAAVGLLASGEIDVLLGSSPSFSAARAAGVKLRAVAQLSSGQNVALVGAKEHEESKGADLAAYKDEVWGYTAPGSSSAIVATSAADAAGLNWDTLEKVAFGKLPAAIPGLEAGRLDLVSVDVGTAGVAVADEAGYVVYNANTDGVRDVVGGLVLVTDEFAESHTDTVQGVVDAYLEGLALVREAADSSDEVLGLFPAEFQKSMAMGFGEAWQLTAPGQGGDGSFDDAAIDTTTSYLVKNGYIKDADLATVKAGFDGSFVDASDVDR